ncbi:hypothetical protein LTS10_008141 [Elasticomyces elasticus]|nr:hypothetical protein LTS10_008141 [Elasticomyces elasticus]
MSSFVRSLFGYQSAGASAEAPASTPPEQRPYKDQPVPLDASVDPADPDYYDEWAEQVMVVPSNDGTSVLVHHCWLQAEDPDTHEIIYHEHASLMRPDETDWLKRIEGANRIYQHLFAYQASHPRIVGYLGPTSTGYRLDRLNPGPTYDCELDVDSSDLALALYQRWALQALSALEFIHSRGVVLNAMASDALWLREDFSIAVAGFICAACAEIRVPAQGWPTMHAESFACPWAASRTRSLAAEKYTEAETGQPKKDLFDWAVWVCENMTGKSPFQHSLTKSQQDQGYFAEMRPLEQALRRGEYDDWPSMPDQKLTPIVLKALRGQYETASEALAELKVLLQSLGRTLASLPEDELQDYDWQKELCIDMVEAYGEPRKVLRVAG